MDLLLKGAILEVPSAAEIASVNLSGYPQFKPQTPSVEQVAEKETEVPEQTKEPEIASAKTEEEKQFYIVGKKTSEEGAESGAGAPEADTQPREGPVSDAATTQKAAAVPKVAEPQQPEEESAQAQLRTARAELDELRVENQLTLETVTRLEQQLAATQQRLERVMEDYREVIKLLKKPQVSPQAAVPVEPAIAPAQTAESAAAPPSRFNPSERMWLTWAVGGLGLLFAGILIFALRSRQRKMVLESPVVSADAYARDIPLEDIIGTVKGHETRPMAGLRTPSGRSADQQPTVRDLTSTAVDTLTDRERGEVTLKSAPQTPQGRGEYHGEVVTEYLSSGGWSLTDRRVHEEIIEGSGNDDVKLLLLTFYKELGRHEEMTQLAIRMLARHPDMSQSLRDQIQAICDSVVDASATAQSTRTDLYDTQTMTITDKGDDTQAADTLSTRAQSGGAQPSAQKEKAASAVTMTLVDSDNLKTLAEERTPEVDTKLESTTLVDAARDQDVSGQTQVDSGRQGPGSASDSDALQTLHGSDPTTAIEQIYAPGVPDVDLLDTTVAEDGDDKKDRDQKRTAGSDAPAGSIDRSTKDSRDH